MLIGTRGKNFAKRCRRVTESEKERREGEKEVDDVWIVERLSSFDVDEPLAAWIPVPKDAVADPRPTPRDRPRNRRAADFYAAPHCISLLTRPAAGLCNMQIGPLTVNHWW